MKKINNGDIVFLKSGSMGIVSRILKNFLGDNEDIYEVRFLDNEKILKRKKDFSFCV